MNVLFTRAKRKIVLFSSIEPEDILIDAEKTARGVRILRDYLVYARDGRLERGTPTGATEESPFEESVANALRHRGHNVALQVGVSGYRIDIAIRHPQMPDHFVLGIECDGATYHSARSARDRDRLRQEALERMGWRLARVWSTDWFRDPNAQANKLSEEIADAIRTTTVDRSKRKRLIANGPASERAAVVQLPTASQNDAPSVKPSKRESKTQAPSQSELPLRAFPLGELSAGHDENAAESLPSEDLRAALRRFRDEIIMTELPGSDPDRCILRDTMIEAFVTSGIEEKAEFTSLIPLELRSGTDARQARFLEHICDMVAEYSKISLRPT